MKTRLTQLAPAKLNLALAVGPPKAGGYHPICSWMVTVDLCDELEITRLADDRMSRYAILWHEDARRRSEIDWSIRKDLAVRAHLALEEHAGRRLPVQLKLQKRIPVGGGLGGGSSDAAAMLRGLNDLFALDLSPDDLARIGGTLGSDVPFLVQGGSAIVEGLGEQITRHEMLPKLHAALIFPDAQCNTGDVYRRFDTIATGGLRPERVGELMREAATCLNAAPIFNDLAPAAVDVAPTLGELMARIASLADRPVHVSGSGSTLFVVCDDGIHAAGLVDAIERRLNTPALAVAACEPRSLVSSS